MAEVERPGGSCCVGRLLMTTTLLLPPDHPEGEDGGGGLLCQEDPAAVEELPTSTGVSTAGLVPWIGGFLTAAHVVSKCLLMACELESEGGVPSEPPTELIPFLFGAVNRAILVVRPICHLRSERMSFAVVVTEDRT